MTRRTAALAVLLALLAAGCAGVMPSDSSPSTTTSGTTETTATTTQLPEHPPGISASGVENASAIAAAHLSTLDARGFEHEFEERRTTRGPENRTSTSHETRRTVASANLSSYLFAVTSHDPHYRNVWWWNGSLGVVHSGSPDGETRYPRYGSPGWTAGDRFLRRLVKPGFFEMFLTDPVYEVTDRTRTGDRTLVTLEASRLEGRSVQAFDATVVVDRRGVIHRMNVSLTATIDNRTITRDVRYRLHEVGVEQVERPEWVDEALDDR